MKLDLHTHVFEEFLPVSPRSITIKSVEKLVKAIKDRGLDGIAVTEHDTKAYGYRVKEIVETHFNNEVLIIPGRELHSMPIHFVELDLPCNGIITFRFLAHPGYPGDSIIHVHGVNDIDFDDKASHGIELNGIKFNGIEVENALHNWHIDHETVKNVAAKNNLILLSNSDAHYLSDVGRCYNDISLEDLCASAASQRT
ncbi:MAG: PHP domain-containing protein [Chloroflexi bacterium]|nr:PHP domain-containing protein [Chloroflexota bacterium]